MGLIGPACTPRKGFSGRVLIGRGLTTPTTHERVIGLQRDETTPPAGATRVGEGRGPASTVRFPDPPPTPPAGTGWETGVHSVAAAMAAGKRPDPSRTRKLSPPAPRVLPGRPGGRAGHRRTTHHTHQARTPLWGVPGPVCVYAQRPDTHIRAPGRRAAPPTTPEPGRQPSRCRESSFAQDATFTG